MSEQRFNRRTEKHHVKHRVRMRPHAPLRVESIRIHDGKYTSKIISAQFAMVDEQRTVRTTFKLAVSVAHRIEIDVDFVFNKNAPNGLSFIKSFATAIKVPLPNPCTAEVLTKWAASLVGVLTPIYIRQNKIRFQE